MTTTDKLLVYVVTRSEEHSDYVEAVFCKKENAAASTAVFSIIGF